MNLIPLMSSSDGRLSWLALALAGGTFIIASDLVYILCKKIFKQDKKLDKEKKRRHMGSEESLQLSEQDRLLELRKPRQKWNTVLFFPDKLPPNDPCSNTNKLINYFEEAKVSIHLCMYLTSHPQFFNVIKRKHREGIVIMVVTDYDTFTAHNNFGPKLWKNAGVEVRMKATGFLMHHKFAIIDEEAVITGSLNWTKQGVHHNQENVLISTNKLIVQKYLDEFFNLWTLFE